MTWSRRQPDVGPCRETRLDGGRDRRQTLAFREFINDPDLIAVNIRDYTPDEDKVSDARILQTRARAGKVFLVDGPWIKLFLPELAAFPRGKNDDQVDTATRGVKFAVRGGRSGIHA